MIELSKLSLSELRSLQGQIAQELLYREHEEIAKAREQILAIAQNIGIPLKDLMGTQRATEKGNVKNKVAVRYRHPSEENLQWTGRGRQPKWVSEWIFSGKALDALSVKTK